MNRHTLSAVLVGATAAALLAVPAPAAQAAGAIPVVALGVTGNQTTISQTTMRPGVVEFQVNNSTELPEELGGGPDTVSIVRTDALDQVLQAVPAVFGSDPAAAAAAIREIHALTTWYGGGRQDGVWQVYLPAGNYYAVEVASSAALGVLPVPFTVSGEPRSAAIHPVQAAFVATGPVAQNQWRFTQLGRQPVTWFAFRNNAHELHFLDIAGVKPTTTQAQVKKSFGPTGSSNPKYVTGPRIGFDVISPGVRVAIKQSLDPGKYLVDCFMPSETDGMPHALMGMYKLIEVT